MPANPGDAPANAQGTITVAEVMTRQPVAVEARASVRAAIEAMRTRGISSVLVRPLPGATEYGILTMRDVLGKVVPADIDPDAVRVGDVMTWRLLTAQPAWLLRDAAQVMARAKVRRLPVVEGLEIVGLVSDTDIFTALAPRQEWEHVRQVRKERTLRRAAAGRPAKTGADLMSAPVLTTTPGATVRAAVAKMVAAGISSLLVEEEGSAARGIITKRDVIAKVVAVGRDPGEATVGEVMSHPVQTVGPDVTLAEVSARMTAAGVRRFPVQRGDQVVGIISDSDILAAVAARNWAGHRRWPTAAIVADVMRTPQGPLQPVWTEAVSPELSLWECADRLAQAGVRELPVVQGGRIIGIVRDTDILRALTERGGLA